MADIDVNPGEVTEKIENIKAETAEKLKEKLSKKESDDMAEIYKAMIKALSRS